MTSPGARVDFVRGMSEINLGEPGQAVTQPRADQIKAASSSMYDLATMGSTAGDLWNWGMYDATLADEIDELIPNFAGQDTDGFSEQLYYLALRDVPVKLADYSGRSVLEVGCGMGEGLNFLSRLAPGAAMVGLDLSPRAVARANARLSRADALRYVQGDAERLPFDDGCMDVVVTVESSHTYPDLGRFFDEAVRVLKPGGYLSHIDMFTVQRYDQLRQLAAQRPALELVHQRDVSEEVRAAVRRRMAPGSVFRRAFDTRKMPPLTRALVQRTRILMFGGWFAGYRDGWAVNLLKRAGAVPSGRQLPVDSYRHHIWRRALSRTDAGSAPGRVADA
jgi:ubiquinone/menaquinone biosynthesis C-methylase UbiE